MKETCAFVFARGGSKGLPRKNILPIGGSPMLAHGIQIAKEIEQIDCVYVSTDCDEISAIARSYGADVIPRPSNLASDSSPEWLAWQHAVKYVTENFGAFECFLSLPATAPLRNSKDIVKCLNALQEGVDMVVTITPSYRNPWFNMVIHDEHQNVKLLFDESSVIRRQDAPKCFDMTTVAYVSRPEFILRSSSIWDGTVAAVEIPRQRALDIDDEFDYKVARFLMEDHA